MNSSPPDPQHNTQSQTSAASPSGKASLWQVVKIILSGMIMIGKKGVWEKGAAQITPGQIVIGAIIGGMMLIGALLLLVRLVISLASA